MSFQLGQIIGDYEFVDVLRGSKTNVALLTIRIGSGPAHAPTRCNDPRCHRPADARHGPQFVLTFPPIHPGSILYRHKYEYRITTSSVILDPGYLCVPKH
jgi:hypothetical protein